MASNPRRLLVLLALTLVLVAVGSTALRNWRQAAGTSPSSNSARPVQPPTSAGVTTEVAIVRTEDLEGPRPDIGDVSRNPFRFQERQAQLAPPRPTLTVPGPGGDTPRPAPPPRGPAGAAAINLKFIGIVEAPQQGGTLAVLSDGRSVFYGHAGDTVDGRFRIVSIGLESVEMSALDGGGRQTIRLTGR